MEYKEWSTYPVNPPSQSTLRMTSEKALPFRITNGSSSLSVAMSQ